jgi:hypothetical protein
MASRQELVVRANAVGLTATDYPNDSKLEQKVLWLEKNATTFSGTLATGVLTSSGVFSNNETITIGSTVYTMKTALSEAKATGTITTTGNFSEGDRIAIEGVTYTFRATPVLPNDIDIGGSAAVSLDNLKQAINKGDTVDGGEGEGTNYATGTLSHPLVEATTNANDSQVIQAKSVGTYANQFLTSTTSATASWGASAMSGGVDPVLYQVLMGANAAAALDNLKSAINADTGAGTTYSTGTPAHPQVTATTNTDTEQTVQAIDFAVTNASIATTETGANLAWGAATLASGVAKQTALNATTASGSAGLSGDKNVG